MRRSFTAYWVSFVLSFVAEFIDITKDIRVKG